MTDRDYEHIIELTYKGGGFLPANDAGRELAEQLGIGQVVAFQEITARDLSFHRCYMAMIGYIYKLMPAHFKKAIPSKYFYNFLKHLQRHYKLIYSFKDETKQKEIYDFLNQHKKKNRYSFKFMKEVSEKFGKIDLCEYTSIAFGKMSQFEFENYIREQLPFIYGTLVSAFYKDEKYDEIIADIEETFKKFLAKLI